MILRMSGTITNLTALEREIAKVINSCDEGPITVDLRDVKFMVSSATAQIVKLYKHARKKGAEFRLVNVSEELYEMFRMLKLDLLMNIEHIKADISDCRGDS